MNQKKGFLRLAVCAMLAVLCVVSAVPVQQAQAFSLPGITSVSLAKLLAAPAAPTLENVNGGVKVSWKKVSGAAKYRVFRKTGSGGWTRLADTTALTITDKKVTAGVKYSYTIRCISANGKSYTSSYNTTGRAITYIPAPALKSLSLSGSNAVLTWAKSAGAAKYRVFRKAGNGGWAKLADTTALRYTDKKVTAGVKYTYTVRCISANGKSYTSGYNTTGKSVTYIPSPVLKSVKQSGNSVVLTWTKSAGAEKYRVFRKTGSGGWTRLADTAALTLTDESIDMGIKYTYTVRCISKDGKAYTSGYNTTGLSITPLLPTPVLLDASVSGNHVTVSWQKVDGAEAYRVYCKSAGGGWAVLTETASASCVAELDYDRAYTFTVRCLNADGALVSSYDKTGLSVYTDSEPEPEESVEDDF